MAVIDIGEAGDMADTGPVAVIDIGKAGVMADQVQWES